MNLFKRVPVCSRSNWNLEVLVFEERGKPEYPENISLRPILNFAD